MTSAVICEFNPFHNGHACLINEARNGGADSVVAIMSGNYVQRGEPAIFSSRDRTEIALNNGIDLVLQLPVAYATATAQKFALNAVRILNSCGNIDELIFGSECGDINLIEQTAKLLLSEDVDKRIPELVDTGISYASARETALREINPECADVIKEPNNILGVEYVLALMQTKSKIVPRTIKRVGAEHNSAEIKDNISSASEIRRRIKEGENYSDLVPDYKKYSSFSVVDYDKYSTAALYKLHTTNDLELKKIFDVSEGMENRILSCLKNANTVDELYDLAKTKRYTHSRIRRIILSAVLDIKKSDVNSKPKYIRVLGFNEQGRKLLSGMRESATLPIVTKPAEISKLGKGAQKQFSLEERSSRIYSLFTECDIGMELLPPIIAKKSSSK